MKLLREITSKETVSDGPVLPKGGWNVGHLAHHGVLLSAEGFLLKLDVDALNSLFDLAEDGESGEITDHSGNQVYVEVLDDSIVLSRDNDKTYPQGVILDKKTLKELGIEQHEEEEEGDEPDESPSEEENEDIIEPETELEEGIKRAFRRQGKKIKRGFRVTSGFRKGRVVSSARAAFRPRAKAKTRMKLKLASRKKKIIRILKSKRTRRKPTSRRLVRMNKRLK